MLEAKSDRREARGEAPLDVEAELPSLTARARARRPGAPRGGPPARDRPQRAPPAPGQGAARRRGRDRPPAARPRGVISAPSAGIGWASMADERRFELDDLLLRPGCYLNPQTEIMVVVDDSPSIDGEIFNLEEFEGADWVLIADEVPVDEARRDELLETFQATYDGGDGRAHQPAVIDGDDDYVDDDENAPAGPGRGSRTTSRPRRRRARLVQARAQLPHLVAVGRSSRPAGTCPSARRCARAAPRRPAGSRTPSATRSWPSSISTLRRCEWRHIARCSLVPLKRQSRPSRSRRRST